MFLALPVTFLVCVWNISRTAERICAKFTRKTCLSFARMSLKVKVKGQGHQGQKRHFSALSAACMRFMFDKTSLASSYCCILVLLSLRVLCGDYRLPKMAVWGKITPLRENFQNSSIKIQQSTPIDVFARIWCDLSCYKEMRVYCIPVTKITYLLLTFGPGRQHFNTWDLSSAYISLLNFIGIR